MLDSSRIPIPWTQRWRWIRFQVLPYFFFGMCLVVTIVLWGRHSGTPNAVGEVFAPRLDLTSTGEGVLLEIPDREEQIELFTQVRAGDVIARIDDKPVLAEIAALESQLQQFISARAALQHEAELDDIDRQSKERENRRRIKEMKQEALLTYREKDAEIETDTSQLEGIDENLAEIERANKNGNVVPRLQILPLRTERLMLRKRIEQNKKVKGEAERQYKEAVEMEKALPPEVKPDYTKLTGELLAEAAAHEKLIEAAKLRQEMLVIKAPIDGVVAAIFRRPGATVKIGEPIMTIASANGQFILTYIQQGRNVVPVPNTPVEIRRRQIPVQMLDGAVVETVGAQVEMVTPHLLRAGDANLYEWGLPVKIRLPQGVDLRPGELVDLRFGPNAAVAPSSPPPATVNQQRPEVRTFTTSAEPST
jgi:multidrug resistance efflux pump